MNAFPILLTMKEFRGMVAGMNDREYVFSHEMREFLEHFDLPLAVYQHVNGKDKVLLVSNGMCEWANMSRDALSKSLTEDMFRMVHPDDVPLLRERGQSFLQGKSEYNVVYRCLIPGTEDFRYTHSYARFQQMEDGSTVAFMYYVDITEKVTQLIALQKESELAYQQHLDVVMRMNPNAVSTFRLNLTRNTCENSASIYPNILKLKNRGTAEGYVEDAVQYMTDPDEQKEFRATFRPEKLLQDFAEGKNRLSMDHTYYVKEGDLRLLTTNVEMIKNPFSGDVECIIFAVDKSAESLGFKISRILLGREYESVALLYCKEDRFSVQSEALWDKRIPIRGDVTYSYVISWSAEYYIAREDREQFLKNTTISHLQKMLDGRESYFFTVHGISEKGKKHLKKYAYYYVDKEHGIILCSLEDVTTVLGQDALTGGYNRDGFIDRVGRILQDSGKNDKYAVLYLNIRGFKAINELLGIDGGDTLLRRMMTRLWDSELRPLVIARMEADHYVVLIDEENLNLKALTRICQHAYTENGKTFNFSWRCGIYKLDDKKMPVSGMIDRARIAEELIQDDYVEPYAVFDEVMQQTYVMQKTLASELRHALKEHQFQVYYQPIYETKTHRISSAEALVRWIHPDLGIISPGLFVPAFEENGYISQMDLYVEKITRTFMERRYQSSRKVVPVAINLSRMDFYDNNMMKEVLDDVRNAGELHPYMRFEVTESAYAVLEEKGNNILNELREMGAKILVDDFGSGYSSFSTMQEFSFDVIKLDMGFVQKIGTSEKTEWIIHSIIEMAHNLKAEVIAEGAETKEQVDFLTVHGCDYIQGYYFSKPLPENEFEALLNAEPAE